MFQKRSLKKDDETQKVYLKITIENCLSLKIKITLD